eukprot:g57695.t1
MLAAIILVMAATKNFWDRAICTFDPAYTLGVQVEMLFRMQDVHPRLPLGALEHLYNWEHLRFQSLDTCTDNEMSTLASLWALWSIYIIGNICASNRNLLDTDDELNMQPHWSTVLRRVEAAAVQWTVFDVCVNECRCGAYWNARFHTVSCVDCKKDRTSAKSSDP